MRLRWLLVLGLAAAVPVEHVGIAVSRAEPFQRSLTTTEGLVPQMVDLEAATYRGRPAVHVVNTAHAAGETFALVAGSEMRDGTIDLDVAGQPAANARENMRGFIGIMFRTARDLSQFECIYIRPTNGRADDQLRRNHATQYVSFPGFSWEKLRTDAPGVYESYVDLVAGEWTHLRVDVSGTTARLFVNNAAQPALVVNDLKLPPAAGLIGLWEGVGTDGYFSKLQVVVSSPVAR